MIHATTEITQLQDKESNVRKKQSAKSREFTDNLSHHIESN